MFLCIHTFTFFLIFFLFPKVLEELRSKQFIARKHLRLDAASRL